MAEWLRTIRRALDCCGETLRHATTCASGVGCHKGDYRRQWLQRSPPRGAWRCALKGSPKAADRELTAGKDNGKLFAVDQKRLTAVMRGLGTGELKHPRFTKEEAAASGEVVHERLWNYILSLESPDVYAGGTEAVGRSEGGTHSQSGGWLGYLRRMATRYEGDPKEIAAGEHKYFDRGAESSVYAAGDGTVVKVRKLSVYSLDGRLSQLSFPEGRIHPS